MMTVADDRDHDATAYVLDILDAPERARFKAHLALCAECQADVARLAPASEALAQAVMQLTPRRELRDRVLASASATEPRRAANARPAIVHWMGLAASILLTAAVALYVARLQSRVSDLETRLAAAVGQVTSSELRVADVERVAGDAQASMSVLAAPDVARIELTGQPAAPDARARALWSRNRGMVFTASRLPALPAGRVYQVWVVTASAPVSAGLLMLDSSGSGSVYFATSPDIPPPTAVAVTAEPAGGVTSPTGAMYLVGTPAPL